MKKIKLLALLLVSVLSINLMADTAEFSYSDLKGQGSSGSGSAFTGATKGSITMTGKGNGNDSYTQIYANGTLIFTPSNGATITKIELTGTSNTYIRKWKEGSTALSISGSKATWTGSSKSTVTLTNTESSQARITSMVVTYTAGKEDDDDDDPCEDVGTVKAGTYDITTGNELWGTNYSASSISGITANNFTVSGAGNGICMIVNNGNSTNGYITNTQTRLYSGYTMKFTVPEGCLMSAISFTSDGTNWVTKDKISASSGTMTDAKNWTGSAQEVIFSFSNTARMTNVSVTYSGGSTPSCSDLTAPSGLNVSNETMSGATLSWTGDSHASSYTVMVGATAYENVTSPYAVSGLDAETKYSWSVKAIGDGTTYCTSNATNGTPFTTLADPTKKTITYNFNDANAYPSGFPTGGTNVANAEEFTISGNKIIINAPASYYEINATTDNRGLFFGKSSTTLSSTAYLEFPAFKNYKLTKVVATTTAGIGGSISINIYNTSWTAVSTAQSTVSTTKKAFTFDIASDKQALNAAYRLASNTSGSKNLQFDNIVLTYAYVAPQSYNITLTTNPASVGTITAKVDNVVIGEKVEEGKTVTLTAAPNDATAYRFKAWSSNDVEIEDNAFEMPSKAVSITAVFEPLYAIAVATTGEGSGTATINGGTETIYVGADDEITLVAEAAAGSEFGGWSTTDDILFDDETAANTTASAFGAGTITATFNKKQCTILGTPNVQVTDETYSSAKLTWDAVDNADYYMVFIPTVDIEEIVEGTQYEAIGLSAKTQYTYQVIASSNNSDTYCDSNPAEGNFTTADYPAATLTLSENDDTRDITGLKVNTPFNLPDCEVTCDKVFVGWSESNENPTGLMAAGSEYTMTSTTGILYAWFATETPGTTTWNKVSTASEISDGTIIALAGTDGQNGYYAAKAWESPNTNVRTITATVEDNKLTSTEAFAALTLKANVIDSKTYYTIYDGANYWYANGAASSKNYLQGHSTLGTDGRDYWEISFPNGTASIKNKVDSRGTMQYNYNNASPIFSCYSSASQKAVVIFKKTTAASSYSDYSLTCSAKANAPEFNLTESTYTSAQTLTITAEQGATIYYTMDGTEPDNTKTLYEGAISLNTYGKVTIKAIAYVAEKDPSDVTSAEYMMNLPFTSLQQLAETEVSSGSTITISFPKTQIKSLAGTKGVYFNIQKEEKDIEIYCSSNNRPDNWEAGGNLSATNLTCAWVRIPATGTFQCWELTPSDWSAFEYSAPDPYTSVADLYAADLVDGAKVYLNITNAYVHAKTYTSPNNFVYVQDGEVGIVLRTSEFADDNIGKLMTAKIVGNLAYSNGRPQIAVTSLTDVSYTAGDRPAAVATTLSEGEEASQILSLVKIDGYFAQSQDKQAKTAVITENANGTGESYTIYNLFGALKTVPESDKAINVKGLFYKKVESNVTSYSIVPVLLEDVALVTPAAAPAATISKGSTDQTNPSKVGNGEKITITPAAGFTASYILNGADEKIITATTEDIKMTADATLILKSSRDYYTTTTNTYYYELDESLTYHSITKPLGNYTCELSAPSAKLNDEVIITFAMNNHWYLDGVTVKNAANEAEAFEATKVDDNKYSFAMPAYDVKLSTATHSDPTYEIKYLKNGKQTTPADEITESKQFAGTVLTLKECNWTASGVEYDGWKAYYVDENDGDKEVELPITENTITVPNHNVRIYAQWVNTYTVTFTKGSASSATGTVPTETPKRAGALVSLPTNPFSATGYSFMGWKASTDEQIYQPGAEFTMPAQAVTFTAQWEGAEHTKDGAWEIVTNNDQLEAGRFYVIACQSQGKVMTATQAGTTNKYLSGAETTFTDDDVLGEKAIIKKTDLPANAVIFELGGESDAWTLMNVATEKYYHTGSNNNPVWLDNARAWETISYNKIQAWESKSYQDTTLQFNASGGFRPYTSSQKAVQLYRFYPTARKVYFSANAGEDIVTNMPEWQRANPSTNKVTIPNVTPARTGYTFTKWNSAQNGTGTHSAQPNETIELWQAECTLHAIWEKNKPLLTIANVEHGTIQAKPYSMDVIVEGGTANVEYQKTIVISHTDDDEEYAFKAWKITKTDDESVVITPTVGQNSTTFDMPDYPVTVSAIYESKTSIEYTLTYDANGGEGTMTGNPFTQHWNDYITVSDNKDGENDIFTKTLCEFNGWNTKADGTGTPYAAGAHFYMKSDVTLYAQWKGSGATYYLDKLAEGNIRVKEGAAPQGSTATCVNTYTGNIDQVTVNNTLTITLSGYAGKVVTNITANIKANYSGNSGKLDITVGGVNVFDKTYEDLEAQNKSQYQERSFADYGFGPVLVKENEDIVILVRSLVDKSAYIQNITIEYEDIPEETTVRSGLTPGQYTTYCEPQTVLAGTYTGATFWNIESKTTMDDGRLSSITIVQHDGALVAGVPYIMLPESDVLTGKKCSKAVAEPAANDAHNGLVGVFETTMFDDVFGTVGDDAAAAERGIYIISDGTLYLCGNYCGVYANRAYILNSAIEDKSATTPPAAPRRTIGRPNVAPTVLENVFGNQPAGKVQKVFIDGQIYIIRDTKVFNAQGQLVK